MVLGESEYVMRNLAGWLFSSGVAACVVASSAMAQTGPTITSNRFNSMLMVDTHLGYTDGTYGMIRTSSGQYVRADSYVKAAADYVGIHTFRDGVTDGSSGSSAPAYYQSLAKQGINFVFMLPGKTQAELNSSLQIANTINQTAGAQGHVLAIEGANEINNAPLCWGPIPCQTGLAGALTRQTALKTLVKADPSFPKIGNVIYFTGWDAVSGAPGPDPSSGYADFNNQHPYPNFGQPPYFWLSRGKALANTTNTNARAYYTETGYQVGPLWGQACNNGQGGICWNNNNTWQNKPQVSEAVQAKLTLAIPLDAALLGIDKVGLYELLSAYPENGRIDQGFGLFHYSATGALNPRPVATALHNLTTLTADSGTVTNLVPMNYTVTGLPTQGYCPNGKPTQCSFLPSLAIQKSNGQYLIAVWTEQNTWNADTHTEIPAKSYPIAVRLPHQYPKVEVFDPYVSANPIATFAPETTVKITVSDHPLILRVTP